VLLRDRTDPQHTLAGEVNPPRGGGGGAGDGVLQQLTAVILSNPFRGSARIVSAVSTMRPALISILTSGADVRFSTGCIEASTACVRTNTQLTDRDADPPP